MILSVAITASSQAAVDAGLSVLARGGNAVDGAVATALAACVADPCNVGIGGYGGYMTVHRKDGRARCVRFGLWAPSTMAPETLRRAYPESGPACSAVPNVVAGLARALLEFGTLSWGDVSSPAIALAREGVAANGTTLRAFAQVRGAEFLKTCFELEETDAGGEGGMVFRQPRLALTLEYMAKHGPEWFYTGPIGQAACDAWRRAGVDIPLSDWAEGLRAVHVVPPARFEIDGLALHSAPLGVSGSACLFGVLGAAKRVGRGQGLATGEALAELASLMSAIWQYRFATEGGNNFSGIEAAQWVVRALDHSPHHGGLGPDPGHTTHLNVVDAEGTMVAATLTLGPGWFGGRWAIEDTGVLMNNGMHNFSRVAPVLEFGRYYGVSNMSPTVAETATGRRLAIGCPGARRIPMIVGMALARHAFFGHSLQDAVSAGRLHAEDAHQVTYELARLGSATGDALRKRFATVEVEKQYSGPLTAIGLDADGRVEIALDDRETSGFGALDN